MTDTRMTSGSSSTFAIVGAGQAGRWLATTLRSQGFAGRLLWIGAEAHTPYERPPLSKAALQGEVQLEQLALLQAEALAALDVQWHGGQRVQAIEREARQVLLQDGRRLAYDTLFLAVGGRARTLPDLPAHPRVLTLRTWEDAQALKQQLRAARRVLVLGAGWIGLEVAASARRMGCEVTVLEAAPRACVRTVPVVVSEHLHALHRGHGVDLRLGASVQAVLPHDQGVTVRVTAAGANAPEVLDADVLVLGIGLVPADELASACGLQTGNGVWTDAQGRSSDPAIYAVGDVANSLQADGTRRRLESWENAQRQAVAAAHAALGLAHDPQAEGPPWFWSDQYDDNLQVLGTPLDSHQLIERTRTETRQRVLLFHDGRQVQAVAAVNAGREIKVVRKWLREGRQPALSALSDLATELHRLPLSPPA
jgi:3-phenylpropionate/trans-cinnamate dioxygenase ferredoxin reductase component